MSRLKLMGTVLLGSLIIATGASAAVVCPRSTVEFVHVDSGGVYFSQGGYIRFAGRHGNPETEAKLNMLVSAQMAGRQVQAAFSDGYSCTANNNSVVAGWIRTF